MALKDCESKGECIKKITKKESCTLLWLYFSKYKNHSSHSAEVIQKNLRDMDRNLTWKKYGLVAIEEVAETNLQQPPYMSTS